MSTPKDPRRVAGGRAGARLRWGPTRVVRLDQLDPATAQVVRAVISAADNAARKEAAPVSDDSGAAMLAEVHGNARPAA